jgi:hypothetical protein
MVRRRDGFQQHFSRRTLIEKKKNFPQYKEIQIRSSCKVIYEDGLPNIQYEEMAEKRNYLTIYEEQGWANLDQAHEDLDRNIFRDLSPTPKP